MKICALNEACCVTMPQCSNYVEHAWRKGKCLNCFQPKSRHAVTSESCSNQATSDQVNGNKLQYRAEQKCDLQPFNTDGNEVASCSNDDKNSPIVISESARTKTKQNTKTRENDLRDTSNAITLSQSNLSENHKTDEDIALKDRDLPKGKANLTKTKPVPKPRPRKKVILPQPYESPKPQEIEAIELTSSNGGDNNVRELPGEPSATRESVTVTVSHKTDSSRDELTSHGVSVCEGTEIADEVRSNEALDEIESSLVKENSHITGCEIANPINTTLHNLNIATGEIENCKTDNVTLSKEFRNSEQEFDTSSTQQEMESENIVSQVSNETNENDYVPMNGNPSGAGRLNIDEFIEFKHGADGEKIKGKPEDLNDGSSVVDSNGSPSIRRLKWSLDRQSVPSRELLEDFRFELPRTIAMGGRESSYELTTDYEQFSPNLNGKVTLAEPFYENRPPSLCSDSQSQSASSSGSFAPDKAEYENTLNRSNIGSPNPCGTLESDVFSNSPTEGMSCPYENTIGRHTKSSSGTSDSLQSSEGDFVEQNAPFESSGDSAATDQSDSTWESSECDSASNDSNIEMSTSESLVGSKTCGIPTIPENEILTDISLAKNSRIQRKINFSPEKAKNRQSNPDIKDKINDQLPSYTNAPCKFLTKPYKVVDVSSGLLLGPDSLNNGSDVPPLPPKARDLHNDNVEDIQHEYMPPPENVPQKNPYNSPQPSPVHVGPSLDEPTPRSQYAKKAAPVPRPRSASSERNSLFGSLPRPLPRPSNRVPTDSKPDINKAPYTSKVSESEDVPEPPSPSTIPCRQGGVEGITTPPALPLSSPPITPINVSSSTSRAQSTEEVETPQSPVSDGRKTPDGLTAKPKRMAPPPPVGGSQSRPKSPEVSYVTSSTVSTTSRAPANSSLTKSTSVQPEPVGYQKPLSQPPEKRTNPPASAEQSSPSTERKYSKTNSLKKAWLKFSKKRNSKSYRSLEISGPILVNEEVPGYVEQREEVKRRAMSESAVLARSSVSSEIVEASLPPEEEKPAQISSEDQLNQTTEPTNSPPVQFCKSPHGYENFPLSKVTVVTEKPKKPVRATKAVRPLGLEADILPDSPRDEEAETNIGREEPAYLQPCENELTKKVEAALSKLNDATLFAEALSRVEQEKLGPLPNIPQSRHVHFHYEAKSVGEDSTTAFEKNPSLPPKRPVRIVNPTLVNGVAGSLNTAQDEYKTVKPKLPSRPPNTKLPESHRERSLSANDKCFIQTNSSIPRSKSESSNSRVVVKTYNRMKELHLQTLQEVVNSTKRSLLPAKNLDVSDTGWQDYQVCGQQLDIQCPEAVLLPVKLLSNTQKNMLLAKVEVPQESGGSIVQRSSFKNELRVCESMEHHVNISRVLTHFTAEVPADVIGCPDSESRETKISVTDQVPRETVTEFLDRSKDEHEEQPEAYEKKVCLLLIQLLSALQHLHKEAVVHRDLKTDNLFLLDSGLLVVANFEHAVQQDKHSQPSPFIVSTDSLPELKVNVDHLPPEILNASEDSKTIDYEKCDVFAVGCLIYEMLHEENPYSRDSRLIKRDYHANKLFSLPERSCYSRGLQKIANKLLCPDPQQRVDVTEALEILRVIVWGPDCLEDSGTTSLENLASGWLESERLHMVTLFALNQVQKAEQENFIENFLKCQYLVEANEQSVANSYKHLKTIAEGETV